MSTRQESLYLPNGLKNDSDSPGIRRISSLEGLGSRAKESGTGAVPIGLLTKPTGVINPHRPFDQADRSYVIPVGPVNWPTGINMVWPSAARAGSFSVYCRRQQTHTRAPSRRCRQPSPAAPNQTSSSLSSPPSPARTSSPPLCRPPVPRRTGQPPPLRGSPSGPHLNRRGISIPKCK
jgi:hypothetical protein